MNDLYNKFRFRNRELFRIHSDNMIRQVFHEIMFFLEYNDSGEYSNREVAEYLKGAMKERGVVLADEMALVHPVMDFICGEFGFEKGYYNYFSEVLEIVSETVPKHISDSSRFIVPLTRKILDEFKKSEPSVTMDEIASRLKGYPELRFIPFALICDAVNSVYDFFSGADGEE